MTETPMRTIVPRDPSRTKYQSILTLAKQGFLPSDIIVLKPSDIKVNKDKLIVSTNGKTAELNFEQAKTLAEYMDTYAKYINSKGTVFYSDKAEVLTIPNLTRSFSNWLKKNKVNEVLHGWSVVKPPAKTIETMEDIAAVLKGIQSK